MQYLRETLPEEYFEQKQENPIICAWCPQDHGE
jgi:hypothetical protein